MATQGREIHEGDLICVTGGSGFIGTYLTEQLLAKGYRVRITVRDSSKDYAHLKALPQKPGQLELFQADIESGKFADAFKGCDGVVHMATPYSYSAADPQKEIVDPAIEGVRSAFHASLAAGVKRLIVTSSGGAIMHFPVDPGYVFTEKDWNTSATLQTHAYFLSKKLAEEAAWKLYEEHKDKIDMVVVNPLLVFGSARGKPNASQASMGGILQGNVKQLQKGSIGGVHVQDVATAHVIALEHPDAVGHRLIAAGATFSWKRLAHEMKRQFPDYAVTLEEPQDEPATFTFDTSRIQSLGLKHFIGFEQMVNDTITGLISIGAVPDLRQK